MKPYASSLANVPADKMLHSIIICLIDSTRRPNTSDQCLGIQLNYPLEL